MQSYRQRAGDDREGAEMAITVMNVYELDNGGVK